LSSPHVTGEAAFPAPMASSSRAFESSVDSKLMSETPGREKRGFLPRHGGVSPLPGSTLRTHDKNSESRVSNILHGSAAHRSSDFKNRPFSPQKTPFQPLAGPRVPKFQGGVRYVCYTEKKFPLSYRVV